MRIFTHLKLWVAVARHNFKWVKIRIIKFSALSVNAGSKWANIDPASSQLERNEK